MPTVMPTAPDRPFFRVSKSAPRPARWAQRLLDLARWRMVFQVALPAQCVIVFYPHTSNWDFVIGLVTNWAMDVHIHWLAKASLFRGPMGLLFRRWGGLPVERTAPAGVIDDLAARFKAMPDLRLVIAPEGTRRLTPGWKSGFYRLALQADVPVALAFIDGARREIGIGACIELTGDAQTDMRGIADFYADRRGIRPENQGPVRLRNGSEG